MASRHYLRRNRFAAASGRCFTSIALHPVQRQRPAFNFEELAMQHIVPSRLLRAGLLIDAAGSGAIGLLHIVATAVVARMVAAPTSLILGSGLFMLAYAATLVLLSRSGVLPRAAVRFIVIGNAVYAAACLLLALLIPALNAYAVGHLLLQALAVTLFVVLQAGGLARSQLQSNSQLQSQPAAAALAAPARHA
jgi:hypothetical protein